MKNYLITYKDRSLFGCETFMANTAIEAQKLFFKERHGENLMIIKIEIL